ncbi:heat-inducible transcriptional repressor HrcA [Bombilactobacillus thymidiniphilus]|uniref:Heat-inducible transcription repressor HrcA n=1 Tax=Bombilactobacillus thymidiniphilus TaxID=2923363 RepID=A0ABY4PCT8_9LACO|nr:heat-inducible transcriptional repressor HrcA [Bombilactobacillus thymidiniphilus]UQS83507.1 heat-inducible transcriptional repressor HrcA [Bombilactobacillus thymidiniphilus]
MITERQATILKAIVQQYIETGQPIGSKALMDLLPTHVSSATIRNDMASLEQAGLIEKIHLSSGRVPSIQGYRYYLDNLLEPISVSEQMSELIQSDFSEHQFNKIDEIVAQSVKILSNLTSYTAIALSPESKSVRLTDLRALPLGANQVLAIVMTSNAEVYSQVYRLPNGFSGDQVEKIVRLVCDHLINKTLCEAQRWIKNEFPQVIKNYIEDPASLVSLLSDALEQVSGDHFFVDGQSNLLNYVDAPNSTNLKFFYSLFENDNNLSQLLGLHELTADPGDTIQEGINVRLGYDLNPQVLKNYSLITAKYDLADYGAGILALLGPTNMPYSELIGLISSLRQELAKNLINYFGELNGNSG